MFRYLSLQTLSFLLFLSIGNAQSWNQIGNNIIGEGSTNLLGHATAISGDGSTAAIGAPKQNTGGEVLIYNVTSAGYTLKGPAILTDQSGADFGWSVSLSQDGNIVIIGAPDDNGSGANAGQAYIYEWNGSVWTQKGSILEGINGDDHFGWDVDISADGSTIAVASPLSDINEFNSGDVKIYKWINNDWVNSSASNLIGKEKNEEFGNSIALSEDGETIVVGSPFFFGSYNTGVTRVYSINESQWQQTGEDIFGISLVDHSGYSVDISNDGNLIASASYSSSEGKVRIYEWNTSDWAQVGDDILGDANFDSYGFSVSLNGDGSMIAAGAPSNDSNGSSSGHIKVYKLVGGEWVKRGPSIEGDAIGDGMGRSAALSDDGNRLIAGGTGNTNNGDFDGRAKMFSYESSTAIASIEKIYKISYGPNPTNGALTIDLGKIHEGVQVDIQTIMGERIENQQFDSVQIIDLKLTGSEGWYLITIRSNSKIITTAKLYKTDY